MNALMPHAYIIELLTDFFSFNTLKKFHEKEVARNKALRNILRGSFSGESTTPRRRTNHM